jgi:hypothetical protein
MTAHECLPDDDLLPLAVGEVPSETAVEHLATCSVCRQRVDALQSEVAHLRTLQASPIAEPERPPVIGKYLVVGELPGGSQGRIFRALHPTLEQEVLIKLSRHPEEGRPDFRHLLVAEGKHLARLDHPNLVRVYDLDFHDGAPFMALEYVRGQNLEEYVAGRRLPPRQAAGLLAGVARALEAVHQAGLVHQDLKPTNILIDPAGQPRLIDFGLARFRHAWDQGAGTVSGGTPAFMSPEQARGQVNAIGARSDLFALGAVLYFLLTGRPPFPGPGVSQALDQASRCAFDRAALNSVAAPAALRALCLQAMADRPEDRPGSAAEMASRLEQIAAGPRKLRRTLLVAAVAALLVLGVWLVIALRPRPAVVEPPVVSLDVRVLRKGVYKPLDPALVPLLGKQDRLEIVARVPRGWHSGLYHLNAEGRGKPLSAEREDADTFTRLVYPGGGNVVSLDPDRRGSELLLVCAAPDESALKGIEKRLNNMGALPELPGQLLVWFDRDEPHRDLPRVTPMGPVSRDPVATTEKLLDRLRMQLRQRVPLFRGVVFSRR